MVDQIKLYIYGIELCRVGCELSSTQAMKKQEKSGVR